VDDSEEKEEIKKIKKKKRAKKKNHNNKKGKIILVAISFRGYFWYRICSNSARFITNSAADHNVNETKADITGSRFATCVTDQ
jgi:hypothetical protein